MSREFLDVLERHNWRGNIRELRNVIERAAILTEKAELSMECLPMDLRPGNESKPEIAVFDLASMERMHIRRVLDHTRGNKVEAARLLNIGLTTVYRKMEEYGLD